MTHAVSYLAAIPSPTQGVWHIGPVPIRAYALCILLGIVAAGAIAEYRLRQRGAPKWMILDVSVWAVLFGIVGGRIYHVITSPDAYFGTGGEPIKALYIWEGGLGIWGAIALGGVGAWIACRRLGVPLTFFADALAPGLLVAQAIGRLGNWFNNELYGGHTNLPWGLTVYKYDLTSGQAETDGAGNPIERLGGPFHPAFLYELTWNLVIAALIFFIDRRFKLGKGRAFALYVMGYTFGRFWIELLRTDEAHSFLGMRVNNWVAILVFLGGLAYFLLVKGPQEHVRVDEDGVMHLVTADGTPIPWKGAPAIAASSTDATATAGASTGGASTGAATTDDASEPDPVETTASADSPPGDEKADEPEPADATAAADKK